jgi:hypothetical protein
MPASLAASANDLPAASGFLDFGDRFLGGGLHRLGGFFGDVLGAGLVLGLVEGFRAGFFLAVETGDQPLVFADGDGLGNFGDRIAVGSMRKNSSTALPPRLDGAG